jgi:hypothetical protein
VVDARFGSRRIWFNAFNLTCRTATVSTYLRPGGSKRLALACDR